METKIKMDLDDLFHIVRPPTCKSKFLIDDGKQHYHMNGNDSTVEPPYEMCWQ